MVKALWALCVALFPAGLAAYPGQDFFAGIEETADGGFLRVRLAVEGQTGLHNLESFPVEARAEHPDAYPESGIYRHGEKAPLFIDDGWSLGRGSQTFMSNDGASLLNMGGTESVTVEFLHVSGARTVHRLPRRPHGRSDTLARAGPSRIQTWSWNDHGGLATARSRRGDKYTFSPRTGQLLRIHRWQDNLSTDEELAAFNAAVQGESQAGRKEE
jgi:hypothetical protein